MDSLCIPRIENCITKEYIKNTFSKLNIGKINNIIEIPLRNDTAYKRIIIKLQWNDNTENSIFIRKHLEETGCIKIVHNMPWYWKTLITHPQC
jgi:hypothetical protein